MNSIKELLVPVPGPDPCGEDCPAERKAVEEMAATGDWPGLQRKCQQVLGKSKDLEVAVYLCQALLKARGLGGLRDGLTLIAELLETQWDKVHPRPRTPSDLLRRANALNNLSPLEKGRMIGLLAELVVCGSVTLARLTSGTAAAGGSDFSLPPDVLAEIRTHWSESIREEIQANIDAATGCQLILERIKKVFETRIPKDPSKPGVEARPDFSFLLGRLNTVGQRLEEVRDGKSAPDEGKSRPQEPPLNPEDRQRTSPGPRVIVVQSRDEVIAALDAVNAYYRRFEPAHPLPLLLDRAKKWVKAGFLELMTDLAPDSTKQIRLVVGGEEKKPAKETVTDTKKESA